MTNATTRVGSISTSLLSILHCGQYLCKVNWHNFLGARWRSNYILFVWILMMVGNPVQEWQFLTFASMLREDMKDLWLFRISSLFKVVCLYVALPWVHLSKSNSLTRQLGNGLYKYNVVWSFVRRDDYVFLYPTQWSCEWYNVSYPSTRPSVSQFIFTFTDLNVEKFTEITVFRTFF